MTKNLMNLSFLGKTYTRKNFGEVWRDKLMADQIQYNLFTEKYQAVTKSAKSLSRSFLSPKFV
jgi:lipopolysaccharide export system protein LptA